MAKKVGVPWLFVPIRMKEAHLFFKSEVRKRYWRFSDGLSSVPNMQDIDALVILLRKKQFPRDGVIVNGQSGDFITGGHIPHSFFGERITISTLLAWAIDKHYSQWLNLKTPDHIDRIRDKILTLLEVDQDSPFDSYRVASLYEWWEWQERQCKYVVSGQRIYDFFKIRWALPLWHDMYLKFWVKVPLGLKYGQRLYKTYLDRLDFFGCFKNFKPVIWRWPGWTVSVVPIARTIGLLFGRRYSELFYNYLKYLGHYRNYYAPYGLRYYLKAAKIIRGPISLNIQTWLKENLSDERSGDSEWGSEPSQPDMLPH